METVPDTFLSLFAGYSVIIALFIAYLLILIKKVSKIEKALASSKACNENS